MSEKYLITVFFAKGVQQKRNLSFQDVIAETFLVLEKFNSNPHIVGMFVGRECGDSIEIPRETFNEIVERLENVLKICRGE